MECRSNFSLKTRLTNGFFYYVYALKSPNRFKTLNERTNPD